MPLWIYDSSKSDKTIFSHGIDIYIKIEPEVTYINEVPITLESITSRSDFYAFSRFVFPFFKPWDKPDVIISPNMGFNILGFTETTSLKVVEVANIFKQQYPVHLFFAPETKNFLDAIWLITVDKNLGVHSNIEASEILDPAIIPTKGFNRKLYTPRPVVEGPDTIRPNETVKLKFEYRDYASNFHPVNFKSYIKSNAGYLPKNIINIKDGYADVSVTALGLEPGDDITVKFGIDKVYSNAVQHKLTVV